MCNWSVIHGIKRKPHLSVVWNWYHFVAIAILHQPRPTDSADINTRLQLSDTSSIPPMHGGFLLVVKVSSSDLTGLFGKLSIGFKSTYYKICHEISFENVVYTTVAILFRPEWVNSLRPNDAYMRQKTRPSLVEIMACRLSGAKPLSQPMMTYYQLDPAEHISIKYHLKSISFHSREGIWNYRLRNGGHFVSALMG